RRHAGEVGDVRTDGKLPSEAETIELPHAQAAPQRALGIGHVAAQLACPVALLCLAHPCAPEETPTFSCRMHHRSIRDVCKGCRKMPWRPACPHPSPPP